MAAKWLEFASIWGGSRHESRAALPVHDQYPCPESEGGHYLRDAFGIDVDDWVTQNSSGAPYVDELE